MVSAVAEYSVAVPPAITHDRDFYDARVAILREEYDEALRLGTITSGLEAQLGSSERYDGVHRLIGDAYLGMESIEAAINSYHRVIPPGKRARYRSAELQGIEQRLALVDQGVAGKDILRAVHI